MQPHHLNAARSATLVQFDFDEAVARVRHFQRSSCFAYAAMASSSQKLWQWCGSTGTGWFAFGRR
jgi:hypothetical protein